MKKFIILFLCLILFLCSVACNSKRTEDNLNDNSPKYEQFVGVWETKFDLEDFERITGVCLIKNNDSSSSLLNQYFQKWRNNLTVNFYIRYNENNTYDSLISKENIDSLYDSFYKNIMDYFRNDGIADLLRNCGYSKDEVDEMMSQLTAEDISEFLLEFEEELPNDLKDEKENAILGLEDKYGQVDENGYYKLNHEVKKVEVVVEKENEKEINRIIAKNDAAKDEIATYKLVSNDTIKITSFIYNNEEFLDTYILTRTN